MRPAFLLGFSVAMTTGFSAQAMEIVAQCGALEGYAKPVPSGLNKGNVDWIKDSISKANTTLVKFNDEFGLMNQDEENNWVPVAGNKVIPLRLQPQNLLFIVDYPHSNTTELYNFYSANGSHYYAMLQSRGGGLIAKNSLMVGSCSEINYSVFGE